MAVVRWSAGGVAYCKTMGEWESEEAIRNYQRFQLEWAEASCEIRSVSDLTVIELAATFLEYCEGYYVKNGEQTSEVYAVRRSMAILGEIVSDDMRVDEFSGDTLRLYQGHCVGKGYSISTIKHYVNLVIRCFAWGSSRNGRGNRPMVNPVIVASLREVEGLVPGRTKAPKPKKVKAVALADVEKTIAAVDKMRCAVSRKAMIKKIIQVHLLTGMRSSQLLSITLGQLVRHDPAIPGVWRYDCRKNKTEHLGTESVYYLGPKVIEILEPIIESVERDAVARGIGKDEILDIPLLSFEARQAKRGRHATNEARQRVRVGIDPDRYRQLIARACKEAGLSRWKPHQLRHTRATEVKRIYESDAAAAAAIGDSEEVTKRVYIDETDAVKIRIARETG